MEGRGVSESVGCPSLPKPRRVHRTPFGPSHPGPPHPSGVHATPCGCASGGETASRQDTGRCAVRRRCQGASRSIPGGGKRRVVYRVSGPTGGQRCRARQNAREWVDRWRSRRAALENHQDLRRPFSSSGCCADPLRGRDAELACPSRTSSRPSTPWDRPPHRPDPAPPGTARHIVPTQHPLAPPATSSRCPSGGQVCGTGQVCPHRTCGAAQVSGGQVCGAAQVSGGQGGRSVSRNPSTIAAYGGMIDLAIRRGSCASPATWDGQPKVPPAKAGMRSLRPKAGDNQVSVGNRDLRRCRGFLLSRHPVQLTTGSSQTIHPRVAPLPACKAKATHLGEAT